MAYAKERMQGGTSAGQAVALGGGTGAVAATGSAITDAAALNASINVVSAADGTKGVALTGGQVGDEVWVHNNAASALKIYPQSSAASIVISGTSVGVAGAAISLAANKGCILKCQSVTQWLAVLSA